MNKEDAERIFEISKKLTKEIVNSMPSHLSSLEGMAQAMMIANQVWSMILYSHYKIVMANANWKELKTAALKLLSQDVDDIYKE